jgi:putative spermidine/putrescine transport system ATP-binding protein
MGQDSFFSFRGISKRFGSVVALNDFSLDVREGELVALLGPSGCGKTTALRIAAGFEMADSGALRMNNLDMSGVPANRRGMGMVFQNYSLFPHMTVEGNVAFGLRVKGLGKDRIRHVVTEILGRVRMQELRNRYPHQLSGGQQQRVALARALAVEPKVLLLDEPLSALDAKVRAELRAEIRRLQSESGVATLFVTHDQEEAMGVSDRIVVMDKGVVQQIGSPVDVYMSPKNAFVARFIGAMNEIPGVMVDSRTVSIFGHELPLNIEVGTDRELTLLVRPDDVHITTPGVAGTIPAVVSSVVFAGTSSVLRCLVDHEGSQTPIESVVWSRDLHAQVGDRVGIEIDLRNALRDQPRVDTIIPPGV